MITEGSVAWCGVMGAVLADGRVISVSAGVLSVSAGVCRLRLGRDSASGGSC